MPAFKVKVDPLLSGEGDYMYLDVNIEQGQTVEDLKIVLTLNGVNADPDVKFILEKYSDSC